VKLLTHISVNNLQMLISFLVAVILSLLIFLSAVDITEILLQHPWNVCATWIATCRWYSN